MKAPCIAACADTMAKRAVDESWDHQTNLAAVLAVLGGETLPYGLVVTDLHCSDFACFGGPHAHVVHARHAGQRRCRWHW